jgi:alkylation response protein AidB-like acyl-CoA dehydrogenase
MHFALSDEQQELASTVRSLLAKRPDDVWSVLGSQVGAAALAIPEEHGGAGFSLLETHVVLEELGGSLTPTPLLGSGVLAAQALLLSGNDEACAALLPGIAEGTTSAALAWPGKDGRWSPDAVAVAAGDSGLTGEAHFVIDGDTADVLLVLASTASGVGLFRVDPDHDGVRRTSLAAMDQTMRLATVSLDNVAGERLADDIDWLPMLRDIGCVAISALQVGAAQRCLDMTVAYTKEREQFGRPIGSFQALKHRMADMLVNVETARSASWAAAWSASQRDDDLPLRAATAKAWCSDALNRVAAECVQMHGGIAITWEHDAQRYFKRAHALSQLFGQPHEHRHRLEELFSLTG